MGSPPVDTGGQFSLLPFFITPSFLGLTVGVKCCWGNLKVSSNSSLRKMFSHKEIVSSYIHFKI
jgi:hypothetical protein